jgi:(p)ppGpp synthase/HD superfamily hydrolase
MSEFTLDTAIQIATVAHFGQVDKSGEPYILHPLRVGMSFPLYRPHSMMTGFMHDTIEDTDGSSDLNVTADYLIKAGCPLEVVQAVVLLTHLPSIGYMDYLGPIKNNPLAREVKIADIQENLSNWRLMRLPQEKVDKLHAKYQPALRFLET